jgi:hypothetical protein
MNDIHTGRGKEGRSTFGILQNSFFFTAAAVARDNTSVLIHIRTQTVEMISTATHQTEGRAGDGGGGIQPLDGLLVRPQQ